MSSTSARTSSKYRIFCSTEDKYVYQWGHVKPSTCPNNASHAVDTGSVSIVDEVIENSVKIVSGIDAFNRLRVSTPNTLFGSHYGQYEDGGIFTTKKIGGATVSRTTNGRVVLSTSRTGDKAIFQTREYIPYQPGISRLCYMSGVLLDISGNAPLPNGVKSRIGVFDCHMDKNIDDSGDGHFFEYYNGVISVVERSSTLGEPEHDEIVPQSEWNIDKLDGTGESQHVLDLRYGTIFVINLAWLGIGDTRMGVMANNEIIWCHSFIHNHHKGAYTKTAKLPVRYEIENISAGAAVYNTNFICCSIQSEGGFMPRGQRYSIPNYIETNITLNETPILVLRTRAEKNRFSIVFRDIGVYTSSICFFKILWNPTVQLGKYSGNKKDNIIEDPEWKIVDTSSIAEYTTDIISVEGGRTIHSFFAEGKDGITSTPEANYLSIPALNAEIDGTQDILVVSACTLNGTARCLTTISWMDVC